MTETAAMREAPENAWVSVIVPCFNRSGLLRSCLESIARQTYRFIEVIVVDDASSENLSDIVAGIAWPETFRTRVIRLEENRGQGVAREIGRQRAAGAYVNYQDSDDLFHPDKIVRQVEALQRHPEAGMCYCITLDFTATPFDGTERLRGSQHIDSILPGVLEKRPWATGSCLWTRAATDEVGPWFDGRRGQDFLYDVRAGCRNIGIIQVPEILMYVRRHGEDAEERAPGPKKYREIAAAYHEAMRELEASGRISDARCLLGMTREIFRICRKLFALQETEVSMKLLRHLSSSGKSFSTAQWIYLSSARAMLGLRVILPRKQHSLLSRRICGAAMNF